MTQDIQRQAIAALTELWSLSPDVRLGQLMAHLGFLGDIYTGRGLGDIDDDELIAVMYRHRAELVARLEGSTELVTHGFDPLMSVSGSPTSPANSPPQNPTA